MADTFDFDNFMKNTFGPGAENFFKKVSESVANEKRGQEVVESVAVEAKQIMNIFTDEGFDEDQAFDLMMLVTDKSMSKNLGLNG